ncbi:MAG TPA: transporter [Verrucomicrobiales bacterium]|nr:transporter [Verrucomicrobiales bacterium]
MIHLRPRHVSCLLCSMALASCALLPPLGSRRMAEDVSSLKGKAPEKWSVLPSLPERESTGWLADFNSPKLQSLVSRAIQANPDLKAAAARVRQARAQTMEAGAALFPAVAGSFNAARSQTPADQRFSGLAFINNRFRLPLNVSWEADFWGRVADERRAAKAGAQAAEESYHAARLSLAASTVNAAITLAEARSQANLAAQDLRTRRVQLAILEKQLDRGLDPERAALDLSLSRADLARAESAFQQSRASADQAARALETLLGGYPAGTEPGLDTLPALKRNVPAGLPSEMLLRRPDIRAAERRLAAALGTESAAKKAFLPSFRMTGDYGRTTQFLDTLLTPETAFWSIAGSTTQSFFQGGRVLAAARAARARYDELLHAYEAGALTAFREVETALAAEQFLNDQAAALSRAASEAETAERLALGQYERGLTPALTLLDARQRAFDARSALLAIQARSLRNRADLHLALGGEF